MPPPTQTSNNTSSKRQPQEHQQGEAHHPPNPNPLPFIKPHIPPPSPPPHEPPQIQSLIKTLRLQPHPEGGYFSEAFRDTSTSLPSPFPCVPASPSQWAAATPEQKREGKFNPSVRDASTTMFYLLTPASPVGYFHRNRGRTLHTLHRGRGRYVVIHPPSSPRRPHDSRAGDNDGSESGCEGGGDRQGGSSENEEARIESFVVGLDRAKGEKQRWLVEGETYKATFLLPDRDDEEGGTSREGMLVSETVMPGFENFDHEFLVEERLEELVGGKLAEGLKWLVRGAE